MLNCIIQYTCMEASALIMCLHSFTKVYPLIFYLSDSGLFFCQDLLSLTPLEVMSTTGLSHQNALMLLQTVSKAIAPPVTTVCPATTNSILYTATGHCDSGHLQTLGMGQYNSYKNVTVCVGQRQYSAAVMRCFAQHSFTSSPSKLYYFLL